MLDFTPIEPPAGCKWFKLKLYWICRDVAQSKLNKADILGTSVDFFGKDWIFWGDFGVHSISN